MFATDSDGGGDVNTRGMVPWGFRTQGAAKKESKDETKDDKSGLLSAEEKAQEKQEKDGKEKSQDHEATKSQRHKSTHASKPRASETEHKTAPTGHHKKAAALQQEEAVQGENVERGGLDEKVDDGSGSEAKTDPYPEDYDLDMDYPRDDRGTHADTIRDVQSATLRGGGGDVNTRGMVPWGYRTQGAAKKESKDAKKGEDDKSGLLSAEEKAQEKQEKEKSHEHEATKAQRHKSTHASKPWAPEAEHKAPPTAHHKKAAALQQEEAVQGENAERDGLDEKVDDGSGSEAKTDPYPEDYDLDMDYPRDDKGTHA